MKGRCSRRSYKGIFDGRLSYITERIINPESDLSLFTSSEDWEDYIQRVRKFLGSIKMFPILCLVDLVKKQLFLPEIKTKTVIFELDKVLLKVTSETSIRPYTRELLEWLKTECEIIVFTVLEQEVADCIIDAIDPEKNIFSYILYKHQCSTAHGKIIKDLRIFMNRNLKNVVVVDHNPICFSYQIDNGIPVKPWDGDTNDTHLQTLQKYLELIIRSDDVRECNSRKFGLIL